MSGSREIGLTGGEDAGLLQVSGLRKYFPVRRGILQRVQGWIKAVDGVDLEISPGRTLGLVGESGCGKTTVGRLILRLLEPDAGRIVFKGVDITELDPKTLRPFRREMQIIFQDPYGSLNPRMTVGETLEEGLRILGNMSRRERRERVEELLEMVGLPAGSADRYPHEFSGGQRQRVGIARALSVGPSLIVCDEPVSALDVSIQAQIINLLKDLQERFGISYLFIAHDLHVVNYMSHEVAVMYLGQIVERAMAEELTSNPLHPYTRALFSSIPLVDPDARPKRELLRGEVPTPYNPPPGCRFRERCPLAESHCGRVEVPLVKVEEGHLVRCLKV